MVESHKSKCPLCDRQARFNYVDRKNRKFFHCEYCTDFQVYIYAEKHLTSASKQRKERYSKASHNSAYERVLFITHSVDDAHPEKGYELHAELHDRATLPLS